MVNTAAKICLAIFSVLLLAAGACSTGQPNAERAAVVTYPEPRFPSYLKRGVKVNLVPEYEVAGVSRHDAAAFEKARRTFTSEQGYMEAAWWVEANFHDPASVKSWLKGRRPDHDFHTHTYFSDYQVHLRHADRWVKLIEKGRLTSLDNPEVRAVASRYGNPDQLLTEDWRPEIPGINAPGDYLKDYAPNPWTHVKGVIDRVLAGRYDHFFPGEH